MTAFKIGIDMRPLMGRAFQVIRDAEPPDGVSSATWRDLIDRFEADAGEENPAWHDPRGRGMSIVSPEDVFALDGLLRFIARNADLLRHREGTGG